MNLNDILFCLHGILKMLNLPFKELFIKLLSCLLIIIPFTHKALKTFSPINLNIFFASVYLDIMV